MYESRSNLFPELEIPVFERDIHRKVFVTAPLSHLLLMTEFTNAMYCEAGICYTTVARNT